MLHDFSDDCILDLLTNLKRDSSYKRRGQYFEDINIGDRFIIRISAGFNSFCKPKQTLSCLMNYEAVQIVLLELRRFGDFNKYSTYNLMYPSKDERFISCEWINYFVDKWIPVSNDRAIGVNVPIYCIFDIIKDLDRVVRLQVFE